jgi:hypothetical protein
VNERLRQIGRIGRLVGAGFVGTREQIKAEAMPVLEDAEAQWKEHRRRRALNGAIETTGEVVDGAGVASPPQDPCPAPPAPPAPIIVRRRNGGPP